MSGLHLAIAVISGRVKNASNAAAEENANFSLHRKVQVYDNLFFFLTGLRNRTCLCVFHEICDVPGRHYLQSGEKRVQLNQHHRWSLLCSDQDKNIAKLLLWSGRQLRMLIYATGVRASCCPPDTGSHSMLMTFEYPTQTDSCAARCRNALRQGNPF